MVFAIGTFWILRANKLTWDVYKVSNSQCYTLYGALFGRGLFCSPSPPGPEVQSWEVEVRIQFGLDMDGLNNKASSQLFLFH